METNELKNIWLDLDKKLDQNKSLNDKILKDMLHTKERKSVNRLVNMEILGIIVMILMTPIFFLIMNIHPDVLGYKLFMQFLLVFSVLGIVWFGVKIYFLYKLDINGDMKTNIYYINKYKLFIKREVQLSFLVFPLMFLFNIYLYRMRNLPLLAWVLLICIFAIGIILTIWFYKSFYKKYITSIQQSLDELKELEE